MQNVLCYSLCGADNDLFSSECLEMLLFCWMHVCVCPSSGNGKPAVCVSLSRSDSQMPYKAMLIHGSISAAPVATSAALKTHAHA